MIIVTELLLCSIHLFQKLLCYSYFTFDCFKTSFHALLPFFFLFQPFLHSQPVVHVGTNVGCLRHAETFVSALIPVVGNKQIARAGFDLYFVGIDVFLMN